MAILKEHEKKVKEFWGKWMQADEIEQLRLVETLMLPSQVIKDEKIYKYHCASIINSYLDDLLRVLLSSTEEEMVTLRELYDTLTSPPEPP